MNKIDSLIKKLNKIENGDDLFRWSLEDQKRLMEMYLAISQKEYYIFDLIYQLHGSDSYEDIFRDYSYRYLEDKAAGVKEALDCIDFSLKPVYENKSDNQSSNDNS